MEEKKSNGFATASLILGIISVLSSFSLYIIIFHLVGIVVGIVGIVLGIMARKKKTSGMATAGFVLSIIGTSLCGLEFMACIAYISVLI